MVWAVAATLAATLVAARLLRNVRVTTDHAWVVLVLRRLSAGAVLYRDVFYGAGPLALWIARPVTRVLGLRLSTLRTLDLAYQALTAVTAAWVVSELGGGSPVVVLTALVTLVPAGSVWGADHQYSQVTRLAVMVATAALVSGDGATWSMLAMGLALGAALSAKQNIGLLAAAIGVVIAALIGGLEGLGATLFGVLILPAVALTPIATNGALTDYWQRCFVNKRTYVADGSVGLWAAGRPWIGRVIRGGTMVHRAHALVVLVCFGSPLLSAVVLLTVPVLVLGTAPGTTAGAVALLGVSSLAAVFPRADSLHVQNAMPAVLVAVVIVSLEAEQQAAIPIVPILTVALAGWVILGLVGWVHVATRTFDGAIRTLPYLSPYPVTGYTPEEAPTAGCDLKRFTDGPIFLLRRDAAFWYLGTDIENPTPYDYPLSSTFGPTGQRDVIDQIRAGQVEWVCYDTSSVSTSPLRPRELETFVTTELEVVGESAAGTVFRAP